MSVNFLDPREISGLGPRYVGHPGPYALDEPDLNRIFQGIEHVRAEPYSDKHVKGDADPPNLRLLVRLVKYLYPRRILEVGTFRGKTTYNFALHSPPDASVMTIALPEERMQECHMPIYGTDAVYFQPQEEIGSFFRGTSEESKIKQIFADTYSEECQALLDDALSGAQLDFAFIDAAHDYNSVRSNFESLVLPRVNQDGVVVFDNYGDLQTHPGVAEFLTNKAREEGYVFYWYAPLQERTTCVMFLNKPESVRRLPEML